MTLEELKNILDNGGTIYRGNETIVLDSDSVYKRHLAGLNHYCTWEEVVKLYIGDPSGWLEVKPEPQYAPQMMAVPVAEWDALQKELAELRSKVGYCENCHNEIIGMS